MISLPSKPPGSQTVGQILQKLGAPVPRRGPKIKDSLISSNLTHHQKRVEDGFIAPKEICSRGSARRAGLYIFVKNTLTDQQIQSVQESHYMSTST